MSQRGAKYAASIGVGYRDILAFYYPGTILIGDTTTEEEKEVEPMGKMIKVADLIETVQIP